MIKLKNILIVIAIILIIAIILSIVIVKYNYTSIETMQTSSGATLSNKKIGWGVKREKDHKQPDLSIYMKMLNPYNGIAMGNPEKKYVYLTFDEGYEAGYTEKLLETLKQNDVKATFFITAHYLNSQTELVKKIIQDGHIIGNHTVNHYSLPDLEADKIKTEIMDLHSAIYEKTGYEMKYIRPPKGEFSERTLYITKNLDYTTVMWSLAYDDYDENNQKGEEYAKDKIISNIHPGAVILLHGNSKDNCNVLDYCIKEIKNMGYEFRNIDQFEP